MRRSPSELLSIMLVFAPGDKVITTEENIETVAHTVSREHDYAVATVCGRVFARNEVTYTPVRWTDSCYDCTSGIRHRTPSDFVVVKRSTFDDYQHRVEQADAWNDPEWQNLPPSQPAEDFGTLAGDQWIAQDKMSLKLYLICCDRGPKFIKRNLNSWRWLV